LPLEGFHNAPLSLWKFKSLGAAYFYFQTQKRLINFKKIKILEIFCIFTLQKELREYKRAQYFAA
jgi:hypothetical protein